MILTKKDIFMTQAPMFNFELGADELVAEGLKRGFITKVGDDKYELNEKYGE